MTRSQIAYQQSFTPRQRTWSKSTNERIISLVVRPARAPRIMKNVHSCSRGHTVQTCRALIPNKPTMCLSLKQLEWADVYRRITGSDKEPVKERKIQKFPSRERNYAVKRKFNNNMRSHVNCESCARAAEKENRWSWRVCACVCRAQWIQGSMLFVNTLCTRTIVMTKLSKTKWYYYL